VIKSVVRSTAVAVQRKLRPICLLFRFLTFRLNVRKRKKRQTGLQFSLDLNVSK